ncbi:MAG: hypothetical protein D4R65_10755 [Verrucomicrobiaceae bacterium]|nr:MAG: hypothetical protein D4R65_10755 [Verrucomicrobiaceae bacterium]
MFGMKPVVLFAVALALHAGAALAATTGDPVTVVSKFGGTDEFVYYIWDTGDGRWMPGSRGMAKADAPAELVWWKPGDYRTQWTGITLSGRKQSGEGKAVKVVGEAKPPGELLASGTPAPFRSRDAYGSGSAGLKLAGLKRIDWLVIHPASGGNFPQDFSIQTSTDGGERWQPVMSAGFVYFPDPGKNEVWIPLRGVAADAVRVMVPRGNDLGGGSYGWDIGKIEAFGGSDFPWTIEHGSSSDVQAWNNLWLNFGLAANEVHERFDPWWQTDRPLDGGLRAMGSTIWQYWDALKLSWLGKSPDTERLKSAIVNIDVGPDGYVWAAQGHEKHLDHSRHYTTNSSFIRAVAHHYLMQRDRAFLETKDPKTGETVLEKARRAMTFQLETLHGRDGLLVFDDPQHDGTASSLGGNYWDFWLFGHKSAFDNALFFDSLRMMAELEESLGNIGRAKELRDLRVEVRKRFNETFWDAEKGRYIGWEDVNGKRHDYGFTDLNLLALAYGLADPEQAKSILDWMDGTRKVAGDDAHDVYHFGFAPRSTTVDAARGNPRMVNTWNGELDVSPGGTAAFGEQIQNGGSIFVTSYHDLHARRACRGPEDVFARWRGIAEEFENDQLRRDPDNGRGHSDVVGILREFPESGLIPYFFIDGILGLSPVAGGLRIEPSLPQAWPSATVRDFEFAGKKYSITADRSASAPKMEGNRLVAHADGAWLLTPDGNLSKVERIIPSEEPASPDTRPENQGAWASRPCVAQNGIHAETSLQTGGTPVLPEEASPPSSSTERAVYYETFRDGRDYSRILRTAFAARGWEIVEDSSTGKILRVHFRFDQKAKDGLLIFDLPPTHLTGFRLRIRNPASNEAFVSASFGTTDGRAVIFADQALPPDGLWLDYEGEISKGFKSVLAAGKALPKEPLEGTGRTALTVNKLFFKFRLPPGLPQEVREFTFDISLLEAFSR